MTKQSIEEANRALNAFVEFSTRAIIGDSFQAKTPENPLTDWTFAIKSNIAVNGFAHTAGIGAYRNRIATRDAFCVARLREAGVNIVGTVNMEEAALGAVTDNPHYGKTHNPHRHGFTPGGSSGGSGAAVAAGMVRVALGTDTMGSCRIPAAYCGVVGFKPSYGRISCDGVEPLSRRLDHVGILAKTVADVRATFAALDVFDAANADSVCPVLDTGVNGNSFVVAKSIDGISNITLTILDEAARQGLTTDVRAAYEASLRALEQAGCKLVPRSLDQNTITKTRRAGLVICEAELANSLAPLLATSPARDDDGISPQLKKLIAFGAAKSAPALAFAHAAIDDAVLILRAQLEGADAIYWPTAPQTAFAFMDAAPSNQADFTCLANFTGAPAISLPLRGSDGCLPVGGQLMLARGGDESLLVLAALLAPICLGSNIAS